MVQGFFGVLIFALIQSSLSLEIWSTPRLGPSFFHRKQKLTWKMGHQAWNFQNKYQNERKKADYMSHGILCVFRALYCILLLCFLQKCGQLLNSHIEFAFWIRLIKYRSMFVEYWTLSSCPQKLDLTHFGCIKHWFFNFTPTRIQRIVWKF